MQLFTADKTNLITGINVSVEFIINLSENPNHFLYYFRNCRKQIRCRWCYILKVNKTRQSEQQSHKAMNQEQAVHHTTLISGYHVSAAKNHVSSEKPRKLHCICFHSSLMLHSTLEWKYNVNFKCSSKLQFQRRLFSY